VIVMSMRMMAIVMGMRVGSPLRKLVLLKLADNANDSGLCWPSYQHIADQCEIGRRTVIRHIKALETSGLLIIKKRIDDNDMQRANEFILTLGGSATETLGGATETLGGATETLGGSVTVAPRTSNSFDPVNEPVNTLARRDANATQIVKNGAHDPPNLSRFEQFWLAYPKKRSKGKAEAALKKINPSEQLLATMIAKIEQAKTSPDWRKEQGRFIPYPATWLNARGWEDEIISEVSNASGRDDQQRNWNESQKGIPFL